MTRKPFISSCLVGLLLMSSAAEAQVTPPPVTEKSHINLNTSAALVPDLTPQKVRLPGVSVGVDVPVGRGNWVAFEGGFYRSQEYDPVRERGVDLIPRVTRYEVSIAGRVGRSSGNGPFFQIGVGHLTQTVDVIWEPRDTGRFERDKTWVGPGLGLDLRMSRRLALRIIGEVRWMTRVDPSHRIGAGLVYRFASRSK